MVQNQLVHPTNRQPKQNVTSIAQAKLKTARQPSLTLNYNAKLKLACGSRLQPAKLKKCDVINLVLFFNLIVFLI